MLESRDPVYLEVMKEHIPYLDSEFSYFLYMPRYFYTKVTIRDKQASVDLVLITPFAGLHYREVLERVFKDAYIVYVYILDSNVRSKRFVAGIGFQCDGKLRQHVQGEDLIIFSMTREEFKKHVERKRVG